MILAGDLGATNTRLGLFRPTAPRPELAIRRDYRTQDFPGLPAIVGRFLDEVGTRPDTVRAVCIGVAGPVTRGSAHLANVPWPITASEVQAQLQLPPVRLLNDVVAMAHGVPALRPDDLVPLQAGQADPGGAIGLVTIGTGYGTCVLHRAGTGRVAVPAETGHSDFPCRTDRDVEAWRRLRAAHGRVDIEHVVSGIGLTSLFDVLHDRPCPASPPDLAAGDKPAALVENARAAACPVCRDAFALFLDALSSALDQVQQALEAAHGAGAALADVGSERFLPGDPEEVADAPAERALPWRVVSHGFSQTLRSAVDGRPSPPRSRYHPGRVRPTALIGSCARVLKPSPEAAKDLS